MTTILKMVGGRPSWVEHAPANPCASVGPFDPCTGDLIVLNNQSGYTGNPFPVYEPLPSPPWDAYVLAFITVPEDAADGEEATVVVSYPLGDRIAGVRVVGGVVEAFITPQNQYAPNETVIGTFARGLEVKLFAYGFAQGAVMVGMCADNAEVTEQTAIVVANENPHAVVSRTMSANFRIEHCEVTS